MKKKYVASMLALLTVFSCFTFTSVSAKGKPEKIQHTKTIAVKKAHNAKTKDVKEIRLSKEKINLKVGGSCTVKVTISSAVTDKTVAWATTDANIATVADGKITAVSAGNCKITAALSDGKSATCSVTVKSAVNPFRLTKQAVTIKVGDSCSISAIVPSGTDNQTVTWASSDTNIAALSGGKIVAVSAGTCKITAMLSDGETAVCTVTVKSAADVEKVRLSKQKINLKVGESCTVKATVTPSTATDKTVAWATSEANIATVTDGKIVAVSAGSCKITASSANGKSAACAVTVKSAAAVNKVHLSKQKVSLKVGSSCTIKAKVTPSTATDKTVTWATTDASIATVTDGKIVAVSAGKCKITATAANGKSAACTVEVKSGVVAVRSVTLSQTSADLAVNGTVALTASVNPDKATDKTVTFTSSDSNIATVDCNGLVTAVAAGSCTITAASSNGKTAICAVTVQAAAPEAN